MSPGRLYLRAIGLLAPCRTIAWLLVAANLLVAAVRLGEPIVFGRFVDALSHLRPGAGQAFAAVRDPVLMWVAIGIAGIVVNIAVALHADRVSHRCRLAAAQRYFEHILSLPHGFHTGQHSGLLSKIMYEAIIFLFTMWMQLFREHVASLIMVAVLFPLALYLNWQLFLLLLALVGSFGAINAVMVFRTEAGQRRVHAVDGEIGAHVGDVMGNVALLQSFTRVHREVAALGALVAKFITVQFPVLNLWAVAYVLTRTFSTLTVMALFLLGTWLLDRGGTSVGEIVTFTGFATVLIARLEQLTLFVSQLLLGRPTLERFFEVLDTRSALVEDAVPVELRDLAGEVVFEDVGFSHGGARILEGVSFRAPPGATVALVGRTGAGKSTAMGLLCRLWDVDEGRILVDGTDIRRASLQSLRRAIGVVFQDNPVLFRSFEDNLRIGGEEASDEALAEVVRLVQLEEVRAAQGGTTGRLGERGRTISGGERQRLGIARALLKDAPILVLDEATSALDAVTEEKIRQVLARRRGRQTTFIVAHRLSTIRDADLILVLDGGRIAERGRFDELVALGGLFAALAQAQAQVPAVPVPA